MFKYSTVHFVVIGISDVTIQWLFDGIRFAKVFLVIINRLIHVKSDIVLNALNRRRFWIGAHYTQFEKKSNSLTETMKFVQSF